MAGPWTPGKHGPGLVRVGLDLDIGALSLAAAANAQRVSDIDIASALPRNTARRIDTAAPRQLAVPSGRTAHLIDRHE